MRKTQKSGFAGAAADAAPPRRARTRIGRILFIVGGGGDVVRGEPPAITSEYHSAQTKRRGCQAKTSQIFVIFLEQRPRAIRRKDRAINSLLRIWDNNDKNGDST